MTLNELIHKLLELQEQETCDYNISTGDYEYQDITEVKVLEKFKAVDIS